MRIGHHPAHYGSAVFDPGAANNANPLLDASDGGERMNSTVTAVISMSSCPAFVYRLSRSTSRIA